MAWLRLDDTYDTHPKLAELSEVQCWRWTRALIHCARHRTDGVLTEAVLKRLKLRALVPRLCDLGLLEEYAPGASASLCEVSATSAWRVHDWEDYNSNISVTREQARLRKQAERARKSRVTVTDPSRESHGQKRDENVTRAQPRARVPVPNPKELTKAVTSKTDATEPDDTEPNVRPNGPGSTQQLQAQVAASLRSP